MCATLANSGLRGRQLRTCAEKRLTSIWFLASLGPFLEFWPPHVAAHKGNVSISRVSAPPGSARQDLRGQPAHTDSLLKSLQRRPLLGLRPGRAPGVGLEAAMSRILAPACSGKHKERVRFSSVAPPVLCSEVGAFGPPGWVLLGRPDGCFWVAPIPAAEPPVLCSGVAAFGPPQRTQTEAAAVSDTQSARLTTRLREAPAGDRERFNASSDRAPGSVTVMIWVPGGWEDARS